MMSATLKLTHSAIGVEVRRGTFDAVVDGTQVGSVEMNNTIEIPIEVGHHTLQVRNGRPKLEPLSDLRRGRGPGRRLPMHRKEVLADFSRVVRRAAPGALAPPGLAGVLHFVARFSLSWHTSSMDATLVLGQQGRVVIPAEIRNALGLAPGDRLHLHVAGQRLVLERQQDAVTELRRLASAIPEERSLVDELIADRRLSAAAE